MRLGRTSSAPTEIDREIASTDAEIDELVYELHGITVEERKIIEESNTWRAARTADLAVHDSSFLRPQASRE